MHQMCNNVFNRIMKEFADWLLEEIEDRKLGIPQLAKTAHATRGAIGNVLRGQRDPGPAFCNALSRAFKLPPEVVFRKAGLLPPLPGINIRIEEIREIAHQLSDAELNDLLQYARLRMKIKEEGGNNA